MPQQVPIKMKFQESEQLILAKILSYPKWRHRIEILPELSTMGYNTMPNDWEYNHYPKNVTNKSFLDVGANDGYYSFEAEKRGASKVTALDIYHGDSEFMKTGWDKTGIESMKTWLKSKVEIVGDSVYNLSKLNTRFDIIVCSDVLSWLDDIDKGLAEMTANCSEILYIKDSFINDKSDKEVIITSEDKMQVTHRFNLNYLRSHLIKHGFVIVDVKPINPMKQFEWQMKNFPAVFSNGKVNIYENPIESKVLKTHELKGEWKLQDFGEFYYIQRIGWVKKSDVKIESRINKAGLRNLVKKSIPSSIKGMLNNKKSSSEKVIEYMIQAVPKK